MKRPKQPNAPLPMFGMDGMSSRAILDEFHYLGKSARGRIYRDEYGVMVFGNPSSRQLPQAKWLELLRWCITATTLNAGSRQWKLARLWILREMPDVTTIVSYSDPSAGHTGALYRACNWLWAPTWHRLRPPPTGNGSWDGETQQATKDRWVFPLRPDAERPELLSLKDAALSAAMPWAEFREGRGGDYRKWKAASV